MGAPEVESIDYKASFRAEVTSQRGERPFLSPSLGIQAPPLILPHPSPPTKKRFVLWQRLGEPVENSLRMS